MKRVQSFNIGRAKKDMLLAFLLVVITRANGDEKITALCPQQLQALIAAYQLYEELAQRHRINLLTEDVEKADRERDDAFTFLRNLIRTLTKVSNPEKRRAAELLWKITKEIGDPHNQQYDVESGALTTYCNDLLGNHREEVELLDLLVPVQNLQTANNNFIEKLAERTESMMGFEKGQSEEARRKAVEAYRDFVLLVDAETLKDNADVEPFVEFLNAEINRLRIALGQGVGGSTDSDEEGEVTIPFKTATFKFKNGNSVSLRVAVGAVLEAPANTPGYEWKPKVPEFMPTTNKTFREVAIDPEKVTALFHFADHREEEIREVVGAILHAPANTTGYIWVPAVPETMPAENTVYNEMPEEEQEGGEHEGMFKAEYFVGENLVATQWYYPGDRIVEPEGLLPDGWIWGNTPSVMPERDVRIYAVEDE